MRVVAVIPARGGSKGIPRKNLKPFNGRPLLAYSVEAARNARLITEVYVSTEDAEIKGVAEKEGAQVLDRPVELAGDTVSTFDVLLHAYNALRKPEVIVCLQPTSPLRTSTEIDEAVKLLEPGYATVVGVCPFKGFEWRLNPDNSGRPMFPKRLRRQDMEPRFTENGAIYVSRSEVFEAEDRTLGMGISLEGKKRLYVMADHHSIEIDSQLDFMLLEYLMRLQEN